MLAGYFRSGQMHPGRGRHRGPVTVPENVAACASATGEQASAITVSDKLRICCFSRMTSESYQPAVFASIRPDLATQLCLFGRAMSFSREEAFSIPLRVRTCEADGDWSDYGLPDRCSGLSTGSGFTARNAFTRATASCGVRPAAIQLRPQSSERLNCATGCSLHFRRSGH